MFSKLTVEFGNISTVDDEKDYSEKVSKQIIKELGLHNVKLSALHE